MHPSAHQLELTFFSPAEVILEAIGLPPLTHWTDEKTEEQVASTWILVTQKSVILASRCPCGNSWVGNPSWGFIEQMEVCQQHRLHLALLQAKLLRGQVCIHQQRHPASPEARQPSLCWGGCRRQSNLHGSFVSFPLQWYKLIKIS